MWARKNEWATVVFGGWMVSGLFLDGWAHAANKPESFFSPWHGVLYSGFAAGMIFTAIEGYRTRARGERFEMERLMTIGIVAFMVAGIGDMLWHQVFGIEVGVEALLSPTHLALMLGGTLMATHPIRSGWHDTDEFRTRSFGAFFPTAMSLAMLIAIPSFFTMFVSPFALDGLSAVDPNEFDGFAPYAVATVLIGNVLFMLPTLYVLRRWTPPFGALTFAFGVVGFAMTGLEGFESWPLALAAVAGGFTADLLVGRTSTRLVAAIVPIAMWGALFAILRVTTVMAWPAELWTGTLVLCSLLGLAASVLASPPAIPAGGQTDASPTELIRRAVL